MKRLFLFAFYDPQGVVGEAALRYLAALRTLGDIVLATDCDLQPGEAEKLAPLVVSYEAARHGEYDFGSYKRGFEILKAEGLSNYEEIIFADRKIKSHNLAVNLKNCHSVVLFAATLGPAVDKLIQKTSRINAAKAVMLQAAGAMYIERYCDLLQDFFREEEVKDGLVRLLEAHRASYAGLWELRGKAIYNAVGRLSRQGFPFLKKSAFTRHGGSLGPAVAQALAKADPAMADALTADLDRLYGEEYRRAFLGASPLRAFGRYLRYLSSKLTGR